MARFGRKRRRAITDPRLAPEGWGVSRGTYEGNQLLARFNTGIKDAAGHPDYPIQVGVAIPLRAPDERGWPTAEEDAQLGTIEEQLDLLSEPHAILVGVITTSGMREFVLYTGQSEWIEPFHRALQDAVTSHEVQVMAQQDPAWDVYRTFVT